MGRWRYSFCAVALLAALAAGCGHPIDPSVVDPFDELREKLALPVTVGWDRVPLETAARELGEQCGITIRLDRDRLTEEVVSPSQPVSLQVQGVRARSVLRLLLDDVGAGYVWQDGGLTITSRDAADTQLVERLYATADVTRDAQFGEEQLAEVFQEVVKPDSWEDAGGSGTIDVRPGALLIKQTSRLHEEIDDLLAELRSQANACSRHTPCAVPCDCCDRHSSPATVAIYQALDARVTVDINRPGPTVLRELAGQHKINVVAQWSKLQNDFSFAEPFESRVPRPEAGPVVLTDVTWRVALDVLLDLHGLDWTVHDDVLLVTSREEADSALSVRAYSIPEIDLQRATWLQLPGIFNLGNYYPPSSYWTNEFLDELTSLIRPASWSDAGGPASFRGFSQALIVSQSRRVHDELADWLAQLQRARDPRVIDYDERTTSPQAARLWQLLEQPVTVDFRQRQVTLGQALEDLRQRYGLANIVIDAKRVVEEAQVDPDKDPLDLDLTVKDVSLEAVLDSLVGSLGVGWFVRDNVVVVTSRDRADTAIVNLAYRCPALTKRNDGDTIIDTITNTIKPDSWGNAGGPGWGVWVLGDVLSVAQTWHIHRDVRQFLQAWEASLDGGADAPPQFALSPAEQRLREAMERPLSYSCNDRPLMRAVNELVQAGGVHNVVWDWSAVEHGTSLLFLESVREGKVRRTFEAVNEPAGDALTRLLGPHGLAWTIQSDVLRVTSHEAWPPQMIAGFHRLPPEVAQDADSLAELLMEHLRPESWSEAGGPGVIEAVSGDSVAVAQSWSIHRELQLFLRQLRSSIAAPGGGADVPGRQAGRSASAVLLVSPAEQALLAAIERPITYSAEDRPFPEVLAALARLGGVRLTLDLLKIDIRTLAELRRTRVSLQAKDEPLDAVLTRLVEAHGLWWVPRKDEIRVTLSDCAITGFYRVPQNALDLFEAATMLTEAAVAFFQGEGSEPARPSAPAAAGLGPFLALAPWLTAQPAPWTVEDDLREALQELLEWESLSGWPTVVPLRERQGAVLVLTHTAAMHARARRLLHGWEKTPALPEGVLRVLKSRNQDPPALRKPGMPPTPRKRRVRSGGPCISIIPVVG